MRLHKSKFFNLNSNNLLIIVVGIVGIGIGFIGVKRIDAKPSQSNCPDICVYLKPEGMQPDELAVKVGEYVQFKSADGKKHNIAEGDGADNQLHEGHHDADNHDHVGGYVSGEFDADEAWRVQFKKPGIYKLHDHYNPNQKILIVVYSDKL
jgi:plastocyanin